MTYRMRVLCTYALLTLRVFSFQRHHVPTEKNILMPCLIQKYLRHRRCIILFNNIHAHHT